MTKSRYSSRAAAGLTEGIAASEEDIPVILRLRRNTNNPARIVNKNRPPHTGRRSLFSSDQVIRSRQTAEKRRRQPGE